MAEPISIASSIITLVTFALQSSVTLYTDVRNFQSQDKDARALKNELGDVTNSLESLLETINGNPEIDLNDLKLPLYRCGKVCEEYAELIGQCTKHDTTSRPSFRNWFKQKYLQGDINDVRAMLAGYKSTINIALANANIRITAVTPRVVEDYKDMINDTTVDLKERLERLDEQVRILASENTNADPAHAGTSDWHALLEEKESTQQGLKLCAQLSAQIQQFESTSGENVQYSHSPSAHKHIKTGLNATRVSIESLVSQLQTHEKSIDKQLEALGSTVPLPEYAVSQLAQLQETRSSIRQCVKVVSDANEHLSSSSERRNVFEDITMADDSYDFSVSTVGDLVTARRLVLTGRSRHVGGQISDESYQKAVEAMTTLDLEHTKAMNKNAHGSNTTHSSYGTDLTGSAATEFLERYGRGMTLSPSEEKAISAGKVPHEKDSGSVK